MSAGSFGGSSVFRADASQFIAEVDKIAAKLTHLNTMFSNAVGKISSLNSISEGSAVAFKHVDEEGNRYAVTLRKVNGLIEVQTKQLTIANDLLNKNAAAAKANEKAYNDQEAAIRKADRAIAGIAARGEEHRRNQVLKAQLDLYNQLAAAAAKVNQANIAAQQARAGRAGEFARNQLLSQSMPLVPATPAEVSRVTQAISKIQSVIASGAIGARRALEIVQQVQAGTNQVFTGAEGKIARAGIQLQTAVNGMGKSHERIQQQNAQSSRSFDRHAKAAEESARRILLTWRDVGRLFAIQALHTVIGRFILGMREATQTASQFQIKISEIRTISQDNQLSFNQWAASTRALSDQFGNPILDVAEGTYEAISNQIAKGAETANFMSKALRFAAVTVSTTADSVNLLSSVMNAYKLNITDVDKISAQLFRTIDLGRVRAQDIANELGRVTPVAASLGITFEELSAALAVITIQGVTPSETLTSLFGVMNKLLKPTGEMKDFLQEIGFASGEAAIAALGFEGVLKKVAIAAESGDSRLSDLFNEIRARRGITAIVRSLDDYGTTLNKIRNDSMDKFIAAQDIINESSGKQFEIEMNRIKNIFAEDFGRPFIESLTQIGHESLGLLAPFALVGEQVLVVFGGLQKSSNSAGQEVFRLSEVFRSLVKSISVGIEIYLAYRGVSFAVTAVTVSQNRALYLQELAAYGASRGWGKLTAAQLIAARASATLRSFLTPTTLATAAFAGYFILEQRRKTMLEDTARASDELTAKMGENVSRQTAAFRAQLDLQQRILTQATDNKIKIDLQYAAASRSAYDKVAKAQEERNKIVARALRDEFDATIGKMREGLNKVEEQTRQARSNIETATATLFQQKEGLTSGRFNRQLKLLPEPDQIRAMFAEIQRLQQEAASKLNAPTSDANVAQQNLREATKLQQQADQITNDLLERQVDLSKKRQEIEEKIAEELAKGTDKETVRNQREVYESARKLEEEARRSSGKRKSDLENQLRLQRESAAEQLQAARDQTVDNASQRRLDDFQQELAKIEEQQKLLGTTKTLEQAITDELAKRDTIFTSFIKKQEDLEKLSKAEAERQKKDQERMQSLFQQVAAFKVKPGDVKSAQDVRKIKGDFDALILELQGANLQDPKILLDLAKQRVEIFAQADAAIAQHTLDTTAEQLQKQKDLTLKAAEDITRQRKEIEDRKTAGVTTLPAVVDQIRNAIGATPLGALELKFGGVGDNFTGVNAVIAKLTTAIDEFKASPTIQNQNKTQELFGKLIVLATKDLSPLFSSQKPEDAVIRESTDPSKRITLVELQKQFEAALKAVAQTPSQAAAAEAAEKAAQQKLQSIGLDLDAARKQLEATQSTTQATRGLTAAFNDQMKQLEDLRKATKDAADHLAALAGRPVQSIPRFAKGGPVIPLFHSRGTDTIPAMLSPGEFVVNALSTKRFYRLLEAINSSQPQYYAGGGQVTSGRQSNLSSMTFGDTHFGDVHLNVTATGNTQVDARALWNEFQSLARRGAISPIKESAS